MKHHLKHHIAVENSLLVVAHRCHLAFKKQKQENFIFSLSLPFCAAVVNHLSSVPEMMIKQVIIIIAVVVVLHYNKYISQTPELCLTVI